MAELMSLHGWSHSARGDSTMSDRTDKRETRSTSKLRSLTASKTVFRAKSSNALSDMLGGSKRPKLLSVESDTSLNTLRDPRVASTTDLSTTTSSSRHPDLSNEVAALSDKLIQAINNQTVLDDTLAATRQELEVARERVRHLEEETRRHDEQVSNGVLIKREMVELEKMDLANELEEEKNKRLTAEKEKKGMEQELADLTAALFEEANKMVAAAKKDREAVEKRNDQLLAQLKDTETLLASHQEQLSELKSVMQNMNVDRDDSDIKTTPSTAPVSPSTVPPSASLNRLLEAMNLSPTTPGAGDISPAPSTSFSHLIKSVCRTDIQAYEDFRALLKQSNSSRPPSRAVSGSYAGLNVISFASFTGSYSSPQHQHRSSAPAASGSAGGPSPSGATSPRQVPAYTALKESKFYKRVIIEDVEPTLRLDIAPGVSWLTKRSVVSSICDGGLVIEPMPAATIKYSSPCALCGEKRTGDEHSRTHRFRTSDSDSAQRHPLCMLCLEKMRSCCDFIGYLRLIVDGHVRIGDEEEEKEAWEETVRLRERMFWSRIGGGVVPTFISAETSEEDPSLPQLPDSPLAKKGYGSLTEGDPIPRCLDENQRSSTEDKDTLPEDPFVSNVDRVSIGRAIISPEEIRQVETASDHPAPEIDGVHETSDSTVCTTEDHPSSDSFPAEHAASSSRPNSNSFSPLNSIGSPPSLEPKLKVTIPAI